MKERYQIVLTGKDVREAFLKYLDNGEPGGYFPANATIRWTGPVGKFFETGDVVEILWGSDCEEVDA